MLTFLVGAFARAEATAWLRFSARRAIARWKLRWRPDLGRRLLRDLALTVVCCCLSVTALGGELTGESCGNTCGTVVNWQTDVATAGRLAEEQGKLLFVMHISGNFGKGKFT